jgi:uncharacterized cupredoxin-like copper-binding protein
MRFPFFCANRSKAVPAAVLILVVGLAACGSPQPGRERAEDAQDEIGDTIPNTVMVRLSEHQIDMPTNIPPGLTEFRVTNTGTEPHSFRIQGQGVDEGIVNPLEQNNSGVVRVDLRPGRYEIICPIQAHPEKGMRVEINVAEQ